MNTTENNKLIAEFMGAKEIRKNEFQFAKESGVKGHLIYSGLPIQLGSLKYHWDWNWLMEVVEKIEKTQNVFNDGSYIDFTIYSDAVSIEDTMGRQLILINKSEGIGELQNEIILFESKIQAVYNAVVEFINFYNSAQKQ